MAKVFCKNGARDMTASVEWARQADAGDYLVTYATSGVDSDDGSRCGYGDDEIARLDEVLGKRGLTLTANDRGLVAEAL